MSGDGEQSDRDAISSKGLPPHVPVERRRHVRYSLTVPVGVRVLLEEETFSPMRFDGRSRDISAGGVLVEIDGLTDEQYKILIRRQRMVRVQGHFPETTGEVEFFGRVIWYDYRSRHGGTSCRLGVSFEALPEKGQQALAAILRHLEGKTGMSAEPAGGQ